MSRFGSSRRQAFQILDGRVVEDEIRIVGSRGPAPDLGR
jgi:hypothetical protein